ncbi:hypothetical protein [Methylobacter sp. BlB1]|uniref:hypothetical protein n=1 Tax=Methylobacter sp. BlB1 TaxID=2785914 RepID=UPI001895584A|nr:hypothetical protein [Methylobacter sp. BlB1]MBF6649585.1 hypothetical protein [Methylobacter sp. BlB1]
MKKRTLLGLATVSSLLFSNQGAFAHSAAEAQSGGLRDLMGRSAAVAFGKVVDIQYRNSEPTREEPNGVPHTFVTYAIDKVFRGYLPEKFTLRIPGGADGKGGVYTETTAPTFARGETDVLFIEGGEPGDCQLVDCVGGRFRVSEDHIYNGYGVPLVEAEKMLSFGGKPHFELNTMELPRPDFDKVITQAETIAWLKENQIDESRLDELRKKYEVEAPAFYRINLQAEGISDRDDDSGEEEAGVIDTYRDPLSTTEFFALLEHFNAELGTPDLKVVEADPGQAFFVKPPVAEPMQEVRTDLPKASDEELRERERLDGLSQRDEPDSADSSFNKLTVN